MFIQWRWIQGYHINTGGVLFGGKLLSWVDEDCTMCACVQSPPNNNYTSAGMDRIKFIHPIYRGDRLQFCYSIVHVGSSSVTIRVKVYSFNTSKMIFSAYTTVVRVDENKNPVKIDFDLVIEDAKEEQFVEYLRSERKTHNEP